jgi:hypothetical protein
MTYEYTQFIQDKVMVGYYYIEFDFENSNSTLSYLGNSTNYTVENNLTEHGLFYMIFKINYTTGFDWYCDDDGCFISEWYKTEDTNCKNAAVFLHNILITLLLTVISII